MNRSRSIESGPNTMVLPPSNGFGGTSSSSASGSNPMLVGASSGAGSSNNNGAGSSNSSSNTSSAAGSSVNPSPPMTSTKGTKGRSAKNKQQRSGGGGGSDLPSGSATDLSQQAAAAAAAFADHFEAATSKIRRTPTEQSPPHSISRTPEVLYGSSSSSNFGGGGGGGGLKFGYEAQTPAVTVTQTVTNPLQIIATQAAIKDSPPSSPGSEAGGVGPGKKRIKKQHVGGSTSSTSASTPTDGGSSTSGSKSFQNGISHAAHMLGNTLNPNSSMAAKMSDTLNQEIEAHMANTVPEPVQHVGPIYPGKIQAVRNQEKPRETALNWFVCFAFSHSESTVGIGNTRIAVAEQYADR